MNSVALESANGIRGSRFRRAAPRYEDVAPPTPMPTSASAASHGRLGTGAYWAIRAQAGARSADELTTQRMARIRKSALGTDPAPSCGTWDSSMKQTHESAVTAMRAGPMTAT